MDEAERAPSSFPLSAGFGLIRSGRLEGFADDGERFLDVASRDVQRRRDPEDVALQAALADQKTTLARLLEDPVRHDLVGSAVSDGLVPDELDCLHQTHSAD